MPAAGTTFSVAKRDRAYMEAVERGDMAEGYNVVDDGMLLDAGRSMELGWDEEEV